MPIAIILYCIGYLKKGVYYERKKQGITRWFWRCFQGLAGCETDKDFVPCEKTFEGAEGEEGVTEGGEMREFIRRIFMRKIQCCITFLFLFIIGTLIAGCASFEATLATNVDIESNTYELAMGYNKEDAFNLLAFGNIGFLIENAGNSLVYSFGLEYEHYFIDTIGISGRLGYRYNWEYESIKHDGFMLQLGVPFSWSYGKITPYMGVIFYDNPKFNFGISFALRNQAVAVTLIALGTVGQGVNSGPLHTSRTQTTIYTRDIEQERINKEIAAESIVGIMGMTVEDKMPFPAWKWRPKYEGIYWEYIGGNIFEISD